ncbi:hypothetical protein Amsp01_049680 [Amycolatopsis sp. NBRC 101858]|uniref:LLM class flavin-dependent oxidoreductase n=1 Tax=Amycolatopsis sp. NBRC 101858 TaxID=3032200 RepID=UPI0024A469ED|nr:LLM class flavin-dependent oxidoreductase [Amycolatopsis sp. NBRC 101858]GLY38944.1 hypothetical protein Amsp01_049680 [Amycolatopsis sp. NBRC 101858]
MQFSLRFDFRNPPFADGTTADRYAAALDMAAWADGAGCDAIILSEHHGSADGYLPSPLPVLAAMAARTTRVRLRVSAMAGPFHDPLRLAEDLVVLDHLSRGRVDVVIGAGYVSSEFEMFGVDRAERVRRVTELVTTLKAAFTGEPFEYRGRRVSVTPTPFRPGGPPLALGGSTAKAARRAARLGVGFEPAGPQLWQPYREELRMLGRPDPGPQAAVSAGLVMLAEVPEKAWGCVAPFLLHEMNSYGAWLSEASADPLTPKYFTVAGVDELRASGRYRILTPDELVADVRADPGRSISFSPLCGGTPVETGWESLRLLDERVLPRV